ncbi:MAG: sugar ABC transporter ATP-binding protein [Eubacteriales bacterium]
MASEVFWKIDHLCMSFPAVKALQDICLEINKGEILGLLGENGSGKSTLIKCLSGVHQPQSGEIIINGKPVKISNPQEACRLGVSTVYQEFSLVPTLSVYENVFLGQLHMKKSGLVDWQTMYGKTRDILDALEIHISPSAIVSTLSVAEQQLVEIAKGYNTSGSLFILDEPTTALSEPEVIRLHSLLSSLKKDGHTIIYISHRLDEMLTIVDRVAVLKNGVLAGVIPKEQLCIDTIVQLMSGRVIADHYPKQKNARDEVILKVENLRTKNGVNGVSFEVRKGEVFGLAGLLGSGRTEIARALFGVDKLSDGRIIFKGKEIHIDSPQKAIDSGLAFITENRKTDGLFFNFNGIKNSTTAKIKKLFRSRILRVMDLKKEKESYLESVRKLEIEPLSAVKLVSYLSGGNQQKVVISRWLFADADFFIMDEPTQGIDVGARLQVYNIINELTKIGKSILLISSDHLELLSMSDRIATIRSGKITQISNAQDMDKKSIMSDGHLHGEAKI